MTRGRPDAVVWGAFAVVAAAWALYSIGHWVQDLGAPLPLFHSLSWDEYQFLPILDGYQRTLKDEGLTAFVLRNEPLGYGSAFWQLYALWALPFAGFGEGDDSSVLLWLRLPSLVFQLASFALVLRTLEVLYPGRARIAAVAAASFMGPMCGLQLLYKPFSVDYLIVLATLVSVHLLARQVARGVDERVWALAAVAFGFAVGSKPYAILAAPLVAYAAARLLRGPARLFARHVVVSVIGGIAGFLLANLYLIRRGVRSAYVDKLVGLAGEMNRPDYGHAIQPPTLTARVTAWFDDAGGLYGINTSGIGEEFLHPGLLLALALAVVLVLARRRSFGVAVGATGILALVATVVITNRVWSWYVLSPVFLLAIGVGALAAEVSQAWRDVARVRRGAAALVALHFATQAPGLVGKSLEFAEHRQSPKVGAQRAFYERWIVSNRPLLARVEARGFTILKAWEAPVSSLLTQRFTFGSVTADAAGDVGAIVAVTPLTATERACLPGFTSLIPEDEGVLLVRTELLKTFERSR